MLITWSLNLLNLSHSQNSDVVLLAKLILKSFRSLSCLSAKLSQNGGFWKQQSLRYYPWQWLQLPTSNAHTLAVVYSTCIGYLLYASLMEKYVCTICNLFSRNCFPAVLHHIGNTHRYDPNLSTRCGIASCAEVYKNFESFRSHVYRKYREALHLSDEGSTSQLQVSGGDSRDNVRSK